MEATQYIHYHDQRKEQNGDESQYIRLHSKYQHNGGKKQK